MTVARPSAVVIGGGIAGLACARALASSGVGVRVLDRGRGVGGRMASRSLRGSGTRWDGRVVDTGASYLTARDPRFAALVDGLCAEGVLRPWTDTFHVADPSGITGVRTGPMRYAAPGGLKSVPQALAAGLAIAHESMAESVAGADGVLRVDGEQVGAAALCMPDPQAARILEPGLLDTSGMTWEPVIAVTAVFAERAWRELDGVFVNDDPVLTWIADDGSRRGDGAPVLVAHVHPVLAARHLEDPASVLPAAIGALRRVLGIGEEPVFVDVMRWTFAKPIEAREEPYVLHASLPLGLAGDAWHGGPRVETAWCSGDALGSALAERLRGE